MAGLGATAASRKTLWFTHGMSELPWLDEISLILGRDLPRLANSILNGLDNCRVGAKQVNVWRVAPKSLIILEKTAYNPLTSFSVCISRPLSTSATTSPTILSTTSEPITSITSH